MPSSIPSSESAEARAAGFPAVGIIAVYFGKLPQYFQLWLDSCGYNPNFDWLVFTDADWAQYATPPNVQFRRLTLQSLLNRVSDTLGIHASAASPYKVCDFKPLFWILLAEEDRDFDYWGHCDLDMVFGDLRRFITTDILTRHDKIFSVAHLTLYRNSPSVNVMFLQPHPAIDWRAILSDPRHRGFDEHIGVNRIWQAHGGRVFEDESWIADIDPAIARFERPSPRKNYAHQLFYFDRGHVFRSYAQGSKWKTEEFMYIHFQKRLMTAMPIQRSNQYAVAPGGFFDFPAGVSPRALADALNPKPFRWRDTLHRCRCALRHFRRGHGLGPAEPELR